MVNGRDTAAVEAKTGVSGGASVTAANGSKGAPDLLKKGEQPPRDTPPPPFDADAPEGCQSRVSGRYGYSPSVRL